MSTAVMMSVRSVSRCLAWSSSGWSIRSFPRRLRRCYVKRGTKADSLVTREYGKSPEICHRTSTGEACAKLVAAGAARTAERVVLMAKTDFRSVDEYMATQPEAARAALEQVRAAIRKALPSADEVISYQIPAYRLAGGV